MQANGHDKRGDGRGQALPQPNRQRTTAQLPYIRTYVLRNHHLYVRQLLYGYGGGVRISRGEGYDSPTAVSSQEAGAHVREHEGEHPLCNNMHGAYPLDTCKTGKSPVSADLSPFKHAVTTDPNGSPSLCHDTAPRRDHHPPLSQLMKLSRFSGFGLASMSSAIHARSTRL